MYDVICDLVTFAFIVANLFTVGGWNAAVVADIPHLIERLEDLYKEVQGMITYPHLTTAILFDVSRRWLH